MPVDTNCDRPELNAHGMIGPTFVFRAKHMPKDAPVVETRPTELSSVPHDKKLKVAKVDM